MQSAERRPSLLFDEYQNSIAKPNEVKNKEARILSNSDCAASSSVLKQKKVSIDDMDMISLPTAFDRQMVLGSPMFFDPENEENKIDPIPSISHHYESIESANSDYSYSTPNLGIDEGNKDLFTNPFELVSQMRRKYITASKQDGISNIKNDLQNWFLYPKPLPKFWRFQDDRRFQDPSDSDLNEGGADSRTGAITPHHHGYYYPSYFTDHYYYTGSALKGKSESKVPYTGEYFDLDHYRTQYLFHLNRQKDTRESSLPSDFSREGIQEEEYLTNVPTFQEFRDDFSYVIELIQSHKFNEISHKRLSYLLDKFELFQYLNSKKEILANKNVPYRDFYNSRKVDRDLSLSGCISQRQLSEYIWEKINLEPDRIVYQNGETSKKLTLRDIFQFGCSSDDQPIAIGLKLIDDEFLDWYKNVYLIDYHLTPDKVANLAGKEMRFYLLAKVFLEFDNFIEGEYLAEIFIKYVIHILEKSKYQLAQVSVNFQFYSKGENWYQKFSQWLLRWKLVSYNIRWNIQITRIFPKLFKENVVSNFQEFLDFIFSPLFSLEKKEITDSPVDTNTIGLQFFLSNVCSMDLVIKESDDYYWKEFTDMNCKPKFWTAQGDNPTVAYYMYYIYKNLSKLNFLRSENLQNTIILRNYCSPLFSRTSQFGVDLYFTDQVESLVCNLLLCNGGLLQVEPLWDTASVIQYLFYLFQIPILAAPLSSVSILNSNNSSSLNHKSMVLEHDYLKDQATTKINPSRDITIGEQRSYETNPFMKMFKMGLKISLSSKSILYNSSYTLEPLIEEYSVAASIYLLNPTDLCELSRTSVLSSGYEGWYKAHWIGVGINKTSFFEENVGGIDDWFDTAEDTSIKHNVPMIRRRYREETLVQEWRFIRDHFGVINAIW
ncbi:YJL070C [Saccharomyces arboricola H-6]|uniref:YJL070C n=1 Tax=Saccharomyces arboricola (strain H-6 / AS 2.3317 / CBS 10644) TaxID=1160507 RepID=J8Q0M2_SACAR|nr:YJL070C [Saccharomyces arboricola H-6]